jgi:hypothetical protein
MSKRWGDIGNLASDNAWTTNGRPQQIVAFDGFSDGSDVGLSWLYVKLIKSCDIK